MLSETFVEIKEVDDLSHVDSVVARVSRRITYEVVRESNETGVMDTTMTRHDGFEFEVDGWANEGGLKERKYIRRKEM